MSHQRPQRLPKSPALSTKAISRSKASAHSTPTRIATASKAAKGEIVSRRVKVVIAMASTAVADSVIADGSAAGAKTVIATAVQVAKIVIPTIRQVTTVPLPKRQMAMVSASVRPKSPKARQSPQKAFWRCHPKVTDSFVNEIGSSRSIPRTPSLGQSSSGSMVSAKACSSRESSAKAHAAPRSQRFVKSTVAPQRQ